MFAKTKKLLAVILTISMLMTMVAAGIPAYAVETGETLLHLDFSDPSQVVADSYSAFYSNRDVFTKHGGGSATIDLSVADGKMVIANKVDWARPVIRFGASFEMDTLYRISYTIAKSDTSKSLSVGHLVELTGELDGSYPGAPGVQTSSVVVDGDSAVITMDFYFTNENGVITYHSGEYTTALPENASLAAMDYAIMLGGEGMDCTVDDFTLTKMGVVMTPEEVDPDALLHLTFNDASQVVADSYSAFYSNRDVFTKHGDGSSATMDMTVENGKLVISNKTGWARPVIRFNHGFEVGKTYRIEYIIEKADTTKTLSVEHLFQLTGSKDGSWPTAPDLMTATTVIDDDSATVSVEFSFAETEDGLVLTVGEKTTTLSTGASIAALDYNIVLGGTSTDIYIDSFKLFEVATEEPEDTTEEVDPDALLHLTFNDASQVVADSYSAFYSNRDVFTKHGDGGEATMDMTVENGKLVISNKIGWARPVIRFNHGFEVGKTYRIEYIIEKADTTKTLSVEHLFQLTGSKDGSWPTAPDLMTAATVIDGDSATVSVEFSFAETEDGLVLTVGEKTTALPAGASIAALDYNIVLGGTSTDIYIDSFKLFEVAAEEPEDTTEEVDPDALLHLTFNDASQVVADSYSAFYSNRDVFTKHGDGSSATMDMTVENGKLVIANKTGWARPVIRFNHGFEVGKTYRIEYIIEKADTTKTLSVEHLFQLTGSKDGSWPTAPDLMTAATVIDGDSATVSVEFSFAETEDGLVLTVGEKTTTLPTGASIAALDYNIVLGGTSTDIYIDSFKLFEVAAEEPEDTTEEVDPDALLHLTFNDASQVVADSYSAFYGNPNVFTKHGDGSSATIDMYVENGKLVIANKVDWARPVIRLNNAFEMDTIYRIEYTIAKTDTSKSLSVGHLIQITGALDGNWPTAPDVMTASTVVDGDSTTVSLEFYFTNENGSVTFHCGDTTASLPQFATVAAFDYAIMLGGECTDCTVDSFKLLKIEKEEEYEPDPNAVLYLDFSDAAQAVVDNYGGFYSNRDVFTKHGNGGDGKIDMVVENGKLVITNKVGWGRPVIRFNHDFEMDTVYRIEYTVAKLDTSKSLSVGHLIQLTGALDGGWPTGPDISVPAVKVEGDSAVITLEFYFTNENGVVTLHCGDYTSALPQFATVAAFDYAIMLEGECMDCTVDNFSLIKVGSTESEPETEGSALKVFDFETDGQMQDEYFNYTGNVIMKKGDGSSAVMTLGIENVIGADGNATNALLVSGRTSWARPAVRLSLPFASGNTYRISFLAKAKEAGKDLSLYSYVEITGSLDGGWPTAAPLSGVATSLGDEWVLVTTDIVFAEENGKLTYTCNGVTAELPAGATLAAVDLNIMSGGADSLADYYIDDLTITEIKNEDEGGEDDEELPPEVSGIVANSFHSSSEASNNVDGHMAGAGIWAFNGADGTTTLTVADSMLQITDRTGNRSVAVRLGGGDKFPSNNTYKMALRAKNLEAGKNQTLGYYIQFIGYKDGSYPVIDFGTASVTLTDEYFLTVSTEFEIREENGVITIVTANGKKSFDAGVTLAAIDVYLATGGNDSKASIGIDNFYVDYYTGEINLDFEDDKHINNVNSSHHSVPYVMTPNAYGASSYNLEFVEGMGEDGSRVMHAIGAPGNWRPQIRLSQGTAKIQPGIPYELSFQVKGGDPEATTKFQICYDIYYTMPGAPSNYINIQMMSTLVIVNGQWQTVAANLIIVEQDGGYVVTDGTAYRTLPEGATIAAVDCGFLPIHTTDDQTDYYVDNFKLMKLLENPIKMDGVNDDADKIIKNGGMEDPMNIGFGRAWAPAENADITLELVSYEAYAGQYSLKISNRRQTWHRAQQRLDDLSIFTEGKKFRLSGAVMAEEDTVFSLSIYVTLGFRDAENPSNINYAAIEVPLSTEHVYSNVWNDMAGEFGIYRNADGLLVITNGDVNDPIVLEIPADSVGIAAIDVWFTTAAGCEENPLTAYYIDNMEMIQSGTYEEGDALECTFESVEKVEEEEEVTEVLLYEDKETGIQIYGDPSVIPVGAQFVVEMSAADAKTEKVLDAYGIYGTTFYTVKLMKDGKEVQPMGKLTVVLPGKSASDEQKLLLVDGKNVIEPEATHADGAYTAVTDILGVFVLAVPGAANAETGDNTFLIGAGIALVLSLLALLSMVVLKDKFKGVHSA